jgi:hypothetical protein
MASLDFMRRSEEFPITGLSIGLEEKPAFNVVVAYQDFRTGKEAKKTMDYLGRQLGEDCAFNSQMWKFDVLSMPSLKSMAINDAQEADIIVISCRGDAGLPGEVKAWIELWVGRGQHHIALVALCDPATATTKGMRELRSHLEGVALRGRMEFFMQPDVPAADDAEATDALLAISTHEDFGAITPRRWGINE